jgi:phosphate-selective porin OprO/OprP
MRARLSSLFVTFLALLAAVSQSANAQVGVSDSDYAALKERVRQLEQLVSRLEQKVQQLEGTPAAIMPVPASAPQSLAETETSKAPAKEVQTEEQPLLTAGRNTFAISSRDKLYRLRFGGHLQVDGKTAYGNTLVYGPGSNRIIDNLNVRRARLVFEGNLGQYIDFRFMPDFGLGKAVLFDAYTDIKIKPYAVVRAGKMKTPLGLERLQSNADMTFIERSLATNLVPNRDVGFELHGNLRGWLNYQAALMNGAPVFQNYDNDSNNSKDGIGRLFFTPFSSSGPKILKGLGFGAAASVGRQEGGVLPTFYTSGALAPFFSYGSGSGPSAVVPSAAGRRLNYTPQLYFYSGPFGFMTEYVDLTQRISAQVNGDAVVRNISDHAWQVAGSWVLTGESKSFKGVEPRRSLEGRNKMGWGAWEVAARYAELNVDPAAFSTGFADIAKSAQSAKAWTVGLHWYMNHFVKLQLDYEQTHFNGGAIGGDRPTEKIFEQRLQLAF